MKRKARTVRNNTARQRAWKAMRVIKTFDLEELEDIAKIKRENLKSFTTFLVKTGYVKNIKNGLVLLRDTGVKAPIMVQDIFKHKAYDPNLDAYFYGEKNKRANNVQNLRLIKRLKNAVDRHGQAEVARKMGISQTTICLVIKGKYPASTKNIEKKIKEHL